MSRIIGGIIGETVSGVFNRIIGGIVKRVKILKIIGGIV